MQLKHPQARTACSRASGISNNRSLEHVGLRAHQVVPDGLEVQPTNVLAARMLAALARLIGRDQAGRDASGLHQHLSLAAALQRDEPEGLRLDTDTLAQLTLIDSSLSRITWQYWCALNQLPLPGGSRPSFDRAALAIAAAADGMGVALESTTLAEKELARGELVILGEDRFLPIHQPTHVLCQRTDERKHPAVQAFVQWLRQELHIAPEMSG